MLVWLFILVLELCGVVGRIEIVDLGPGRQMPYLPHVRSPKLGVNVIWMVFGRRRVREKERKRPWGAFYILSPGRGLLFGRGSSGILENLMTNTRDV